MSFLDNEGDAALNKRDKLGFFGNCNIDLRDLSSTGADTGVSSECLETGDADLEISSIVDSAAGVSPKSMSDIAASVPDIAGGWVKSSSRRSRSSVRTVPGMLSEGPRESMKALRVIRLVAE